MQVSLFVLLLTLLMTCVALATSLRLFKQAQAEGWTGIESTVLAIICFLMLLLGFYLFNVSAYQEEGLEGGWLLPTFFAWPLLFSYPLAIFRLLRKPILEHAPKGWTRQEFLGFRQQQLKGLRLAAISAAFGLCPSVIVCVILLFERPLPLPSVGYLSLFSGMQALLLRSVKHTCARSNQSAAVLKPILIGAIGSVIFILVMLMVAGAGL